MTSTGSKNDNFPPDLEAPVRTWKQRLAAFLIILIIISIGIGIAGYLVNSKPQAKRLPPAKMKTMVTVQTVNPSSTRVNIKAMGRVIPSREIDLQARVSGTVEYLHPRFHPGGRIKKGEVLVRLDDTDYQLALRRKVNALEQARADLRIEEGNQVVARQEWDYISGQSEGLDNSSIDLALRKPQLEKVKAVVDSAEIEVEKARVDLDRTTIKAPFNLVVREKLVDLGSQVSSQSRIAVLAGIDTFWAEVSVPVDKLKWLNLPGDDESGPRADIYAGEYESYRGEVVRLLSDLDQEGLMARLLIAVDDPMGLRNQRTPLLLGSFIRAGIAGKELTDVFRIPREALIEGDHVYLVTADNSLHIQPVNVVRKNTGQVFINKGLEAGDRIVNSDIPAPIEGMPLTIADQDSDKVQGRDK